MSENNIKKEVHGYLVTFISMVALAFIIVGISYLHLSWIAAAVLTISVALVEAAIAACYLMHLIAEKKAIYFVLILAVIFFLGLLLIPFFESGSVPEGSEHLEKYTAKKIDYHHHAEEPEKKE